MLNRFMGQNVHFSNNNIKFAKITSHPAFRLAGTITVPGDKSISHRALMLGAVATGETIISGLLESGDVLATANAMRALGAKVEKLSYGKWKVTGVGAAGFTSAKQAIDFGNAGTGIRLCLGLIAGHNIQVEFIGDESLSKRPMGRVLQPLALMGLNTNSNDGCLPIKVCGNSTPIAVHHTLTVASAQVKSALLLAGLNCDGQTIIDEPGPSRNHTENMLLLFGADLQTKQLSGNGRQITLNGRTELQAQNIVVPGDPSSAAFAMTAALIIPDSDICIKNVMINSTRSGMLQTLQQAGYAIHLQNERISGGEKVADLRVMAGGSSPISPDPDLAVTMIDEYPALMLLAAFAKGTSRFLGIGELRVKESDRIAKMEKLLSDNGVVVRSGANWVEIDGIGSVFGPINPLDKVQDFVVDEDHRIAMCALVLGMASYLPISIADGSSIATSYPGFIADMQNLGAKMVAKTTAKPLVIAVDGPMASGKGTLARKLAAHFCLPYLDTGLLYRATARAALQAGVDLNDQNAIAKLAKNLSLPIMQIEELRLAHIGLAASKVAVLPKVRDALLDVQRSFANSPDGAVLDGRDIGTVICPDADVKLWITASEQVRAERRRQELLQSGQQITAEAMLAQLQERDARDAARNNAPMTMAENAHLIDTSKLSIDAAFQVARQWVERKMD